VFSTQLASLYRQSGGIAGQLWVSIWRLWLCWGAGERTGKSCDIFRPLGGSCGYPAPHVKRDIEDAQILHLTCMEASIEANHYWKEKGIGPANTGKGGCQYRGFLVTGRYLEEKGIYFPLPWRKEDDSLWGQRALRRQCLLLPVGAWARCREPTSPSFHFLICEWQ